VNETIESSSLESPVQPRTVIRAEILRRFLLVIGSFIFALCLIEFPALINRLDYREILGNNFAWWPINNVNDPELIHIRRPYLHFSGTTRGGGITAGYLIPASDMTDYHWDDKYDHNGFRNDVDLTRADMIVLGDSMVEGMTVPTEKLTTSLLAHLQDKLVANLGQSAYGPQQELIVLRRYGLRLKPSTVFWMFSETTDLSDVVTYDRMMSNPPDALHAFWARSFTRIAYLRLFHGSKRAGIKHAAIFHTSKAKATTVYFPYASRPLTQADLGAIDETARILTDAQNACAAQGCHLIFVFVPDKFRVLHGFCEYPQESECRNWTVNDMPARVEKAIRSISADIGYVDLTPSLVEATAQGVLPYYTDDEHWSPEGHRIAAEAISEYLRSSVPMNAVATKTQSQPR
jgi:hypothetical protein